MGHLKPKRQSYYQHNNFRFFLIFLFFYFLEGIYKKKKGSEPHPSNTWDNIPIQTILKYI